MLNDKKAVRKAKKEEKVYIEAFILFNYMATEIAQCIDVKECIRKISKVETMLEEIKKGLSSMDHEFQESVKQGEKDIQEGRVTVCKTTAELDRFFASI